MSDEMIFNKVKSFLKEDLNVEEDVTMDSNFKDDLSIDSLDMADLFFFVEDLIGESIKEDDFSKLTTMKDAINYIKSKGVKIG